MVSQKEIQTVLNLLTKDKKKHKSKTMLEEYKHLSAFQLLIMTLLSARSKDSTVIPIALKLFKKYGTAETMLQLNQRELSKKIHGIGFHNTKAKHILQLCVILLDQFEGKVPKTRKELMSLPGVGRKTANCILSYVYGVPAIAVDIHVHRITNKNRLAWINTKTPEQTEQELMKLLPKNKWIKVNSLLVDHGQRICAPVRPKCEQCKITKYCKYPNEK